MRALCGLFLALVFALPIGCRVSGDYLLRKTSAELGVAQSSCRATMTRPNDGSGNFGWDAVCDGRKYACEQKCFGRAGCTTNCKETRSSEAHTLTKVVVDRLALETGCPKKQIEIVSQSEWKRGSETAYRMKACGKMFVCTTAAGRTDCKAALVQAPAESPPEVPARTPTKE